MEKIQGKIQAKKIEQGISKMDKPYTRAIFTINDKVYSSFDDKIISRFMPDDYVEVELERKGAFLNMVAMKTVDDPSGDVKAQVVKPGANGKTQTYINRMNCIANSLKFFELGYEPEVIEDIIKTANILLNYVENGNYENN